MQNNSILFEIIIVGNAFHLLLSSIHYAVVYSVASIPFWTVLPHLSVFWFFFEVFAWATCTQLDI